MILKDVSLGSPEQNICFDEVLFTLAEQDVISDVLRFWESSVYFVVLGRGGRPQEDLIVSEITRDKIPVLRRCSGGGTVVQGPGCLNFCLVVNKNAYEGFSDLRRSYQVILGKIVSALNSLGIISEVFPISDIALSKSRKKFSGNAQKRGRQVVLHHGTILYNFNLPLISRYLKMPAKIPDYRLARSHEDFLANIGVVSEKIKRAIREEFSVTREDAGISLQEQNQLDALILKGKYQVDFSS